MGDPHDPASPIEAKLVELEIVANLASVPGGCLSFARAQTGLLRVLGILGVATLHGLEEANGGVPVLVVELVEGEALAGAFAEGCCPCEKH